MNQARKAKRQLVGAIIITCLVTVVVTLLVTHEDPKPEVVTMKEASQLAPGNTDKLKEHPNSYFYQIKGVQVEKSPTKVHFILTNPEGRNLTEIHYQVHLFDSQGIELEDKSGHKGVRRLRTYSNSGHRKEIPVEYTPSVTPDNWDGDIHVEVTAYREGADPLFVGR